MSASPRPTGRAPARLPRDRWDVGVALTPGIRIDHDLVVLGAFPRQRRVEAEPDVGRAGRAIRSFLDGSERPEDRATTHPAVKVGRDVLAALAEPDDIGESLVRFLQVAVSLDDPDRLTDVSPRARLVPTRFASSAGRRCRGFGPGGMGGRAGGPPSAWRWSVRPATLRSVTGSIGRRSRVARVRPAQGAMRSALRGLQALRGRGTSPMRPGAIRGTRAASGSPPPPHTP